MSTCPRCGRYVFPGATDCPACGHLFGPPAQPPAGRLLGHPLFPQYRSVPPGLAWVLVALAFFMFWLGYTFVQPGALVNCPTYGHLVCRLAFAAGELMFGRARAHLGFVAFCLATGLALLYLGWRLRRVRAALVWDGCRPPA